MMKSTNTLHLALLILLTSSSLVLAQDVEVNLDVLENYTPPPMFDAPVESSLTRDKIKPKVSEKWAVIPKPKKKPPYYTSTSYVQPLKKSSPVETVEKEVTFISPSPVKRPEKFIASEDFVQEARRKHGLEPMDIPASKLSSNDINITDADVRDVLASIDPDASLPPEKEGKLKEPKMKKKRVYAKPLHNTKDVITLDFTSKNDALEADIPPDITKRIGSYLKRSQNNRISIMGYAGLNEENEIEAKRLSLQRALSVREQLTKNNIPKEQIDLMPMGNDTDKTPIDRVEITFTHSP